MKGLGAIVAFGYITPVTYSIRGERKMVLVDGEHAVSTCGLMGQGGLR